MIDVYGMSSPNVVKITIMLEELGLPYRQHHVNVFAGDQHEAQFLKISPNNKVPVILDADGPGGAALPVFESGAILIYLAEKSGRLLPAARRRARRGARMAHGAAHRGGPDVRPAGAFHPLRADRQRLQPAALHQRGAASLRGAGAAAAAGGLPRRRIVFDRRRRHLAVDSHRERHLSVARRRRPPAARRWQPGRRSGAGSGSSARGPRSSAASPAASASSSSTGRPSAAPRRRPSTASSTAASTSARESR